MPGDLFRGPLSLGPKRAIGWPPGHALKDITRHGVG